MQQITYQNKTSSQKSLFIITLRKEEFDGTPAIAHDQEWTQVGARALGPIFFYIVIIYFIFVVGPPSKTLGPLFPNQPS